MVIVGIITNFAAEGTGRDASDRGYRVVVLGNCCESITDEMQASVVTQILPVISEVVGAADFARSVARDRRSLRLCFPPPPRRAC